jgi:hypothetical protein
MHERDRLCAEASAFRPQKNPLLAGFLFLPALRRRAP